MKQTKMNLENQKLKELLDELGWTYPTDQDFSQPYTVYAKKGTADARISWDKYKDGYTLDWGNRAIKFSKTLTRNLNDIQASAERREASDRADELKKKSLRFLADMIGYKDELSSWITTSLRCSFKELEGCPEGAENVILHFNLNSSGNHTFNFDRIEKWTPEMSKFVENLFNKLEDFKILNQL